LDLAITQFKQKEAGTEVEVRWHPYIIDPSTQIDGEDCLAYNIRRWGSDDWIEYLKEEGTPSGACFQNWKFWPNTLKAHILMQYVEDHHKDHKKVDETKELLFKKCYEEGQNISDVRVLLEIAKELGLDEQRDAIRAYIEGEDGRKKVMARDKKAKREMGIGGVPFFVVEKKYSMSGAQKTKAFLRTFEKVLAEKRKK